MTVAPPGQCPDISLKLINSFLLLPSILFLIVVLCCDIGRDVNFLLCVFFFPLGGFIINTEIEHVVKSTDNSSLTLLANTLLVFSSEPQYPDPCVRWPSSPRAWPGRGPERMTEWSPCDP